MWFIGACEAKAGNGQQQLTAEICCRFCLHRAGWMTGELEQLATACRLVGERFY